MSTDTLDASITDTDEDRADGRWVVRSVAGADATKTYRCPGCSQTIPPGTPHVVVWPSAPTSWLTDSPVAERRHWHTRCWQARHTSRP